MMADNNAGPSSDVDRPGPGSQAEQPTITEQATNAGRGSAAAQRAADVRRYLTFSLAGESYALDINEVTEIIEFRALTQVPMMPEFIRGVINLRGRVLPVVDLAARFGHGMTTTGRRTAIIIVEIPALGSPASVTGNSPDGAAGQGHDGDEDGVQEIGVLVDAVNKVVHFDLDDIKAPPAFGAGIRTEFIDGIAKLDDQFI